MVCQARRIGRHDLIASLLKQLAVRWQPDNACKLTRKGRAKSVEGKRHGCYTFLTPTDSPRGQVTPLEVALQLHQTQEVLA